MVSGKKILKIAAPFLILVVGIAIMSTLVSSREAPHKREKKVSGALVNVESVKRGDAKIVLRATGTAEPTRTVTIIPQVSGKLLFVSDSLVQGGIVPEGKVLMKIEDVDYRLNVERAKAAFASNELELARIESEARVARSTWKSAGGSSLKGSVKPSPLTVYTPQLKKARAGLLSAKAALTQEEVNLQRTVLRAPFNAIVRTENAELGQYVQSGTVVATLTGTDSIEIVVPIRVDDLEWVDIPAAGSGERGSSARVSIETNGRTFMWKGSVVRLLGEVDPNGRMNRLVIRVNDPYGLKRLNLKKGSGRPQLAIGSFVDVELDGDIMKGVFSISRSALRDGSTVWTLGEESTLKIQKVKPVRVNDETVLIKDGLADGTLVITTDLTGAANGMKLRTVSGKSKTFVGKEDRAGKAVSKEVKE